jgi:type I restriction enzyme, S subunit
MQSPLITVPLTAFWHLPLRPQLSCTIAGQQLGQLARLNAHFLDALGLKVSEMPVARKYLAVPWSQFRRWSVSYNEASLRLTSLSRGQYSVVELGSVLELVQYGTSDKADISSEGVPILRINNIKDGTVDTGYLKYIRLPQKSRGSLLLKEGDILIIRTSGSRDLVGTSAVFHEQGEFVFASYLIRLRVRAGIANPDFVSWFLNSDIGRQQINATSCQIMQNNINSAEISSLLIPLPPLSVQNKIVHRIEEDRQNIAKESVRSQQLRSQVEQEVEEMILGIWPVTDAREQSQGRVVRVTAIKTKLLLSSRRRPQKRPT